MREETEEVEGEEEGGDFNLAMLQVKSMFCNIWIKYLSAGENQRCSTMRNSTFFVS